MKGVIQTLLVVAIGLFGNPLTAEALSFLEENAGGFTETTVVNPFYRVTLTSRGGRIKSLVHKQSSKEMVLWAPGEGGWLDDRGMRTGAAYICTPILISEGKIVLEYAFTDQTGFAWKKTYTFYDELPVVDVHYEIANQTDSSCEYEQQIRNFIAPAEGLRCCFHTDRGVQNIAWGSWGPAGEVTYPKIAGDWLAWVHEAGWGLAVVCSPLDQIYFWHGAPRGTVEWIYPKVCMEPGGTFQADARLILFSGLDSVAQATKDYLLSFSSSEEDGVFKFTNTFVPISGRFENAGSSVLKTTIFDSRRNRITSLENAELVLDLNAAPAEVSREWDAPAEGLYIIQQAVFLKGEKLGEYEIPVVAGVLPPEAAVYRHPEFPKEKQRLDIRLTREDLKRGYFLNRPDGTKIHALESLSLDLCRGEEEFLDLRCTTFKDLGDVKITINRSEGFPGRASVWIEEEDYHLFENRPLKAVPGGRNKFFVELNTVGVDAGDYDLELQITPMNGAPCTLPIHITVWPLGLPKGEMDHVSFWGSSYENIHYSLLANVRNTEKRLALWRTSLKHQYRAGSRTLEIRPDLQGSHPSFIRVKELKEGYLPVLDLSEWDRVLDIALEEGMRHALFRCGWGQSDWLSPDYEDLSFEKQEEANLFVMKQLFSHLRNKGFDRIFWFLLSDLNLGYENIEAVCRRLDVVKKICPDVELQGYGFPGISLPKMQSLADRLTWISPFWSVYSVTEWMNDRQLSLLPGTLRTVRILSGYKNEYGDIRRWAWKAWKAGLTGYQVYGYHTHSALDKYCCVFMEPEGPVPAGSYFALIDAWEDLVLLRELSRRQISLAQAGKTEQAERLAEWSARLVGSKDAILGWQMVSGAGFVSPEIIGNDHALRTARRELLKVLAEERGDDRKSEHNDSRIGKLPAKHAK